MPTTLDDIDTAELHARLRGTGLNIVIGPFTVRLQTGRLTAFTDQLRQLYRHYPVTDSVFADYHVSLFRLGGLRRWWRPQVQFDTDGERPFAPFPDDTVLPFWEWGLNYCVACRANQYLLLHAGVLEKNGRAVLLPAKPGSGKTTLSAALCQRGWRLLSDEFALVPPVTDDPAHGRRRPLQVVPFPRLLPLKNDAIEVIREFAPQAVIGPEFPKTRKGRVAHLSPPPASVGRATESARPAWVVFPQYRAGSPLRLRPFAKESAFLKLSSNSFNYEFIGLNGFTTVARLIEECDCYTLEYSDLDQAVDQFAALAAGEARPSAAAAPRVDVIDG